MTVVTEASASITAQWAKAIDHTRCIGCHACTTACKSENDVPLSVNRTYVKYVDVGTFPHARRSFQVTRCNQCADPPCVVACPTAAMYQRDDGIVDFDKAACIGCKACIAACPYDAIFINPNDHSAEKCNFCAHRIDMGLEPACVVVCPTQAIIVGDLHDPQSRVAQLAQRQATAVRRPEKETRPKLFYVGAHHATLDPLAAARPDGGLFLWSEQAEGPSAVVSGHPRASTSSAAALLSYDVPHKAPWDWRVSLYTWTKGVAAGAYLIPVLLVVVGWLNRASPLWQWGPPVLGGSFLAATGVLLIWDLEHPTRFWYIFARPQLRSWLVRGGFIIGAYSAILACHFAAALVGAPRVLLWLAIAGVPLAAMTAVYTAYLFAQAKGRDLWQNPLLPPQLLVQACLVGSAALLPLATVLEPAVVPTLLRLVAFGASAYLLLVLGEMTLTHPTAQARLGAWEMTSGRYRRFFWAGMGLLALAMTAPWLGVTAGPVALLAVLAHEHAFVQAGQAVPLA